MNDTPTITRDGSRAWINTPLDSPYAIRLQGFRAHWDRASGRWWVGNTKANALEQLMSRPLGDVVDEPPPPTPEARSAAALLVDIAREDYTLGITETGEPYGIHCDTPHLALMLRGGRTGLRAALAQRYWDAYNAPAPQQAIADACLVLEGMAAQENPRAVALRIAEAGRGLQHGPVYLDMGDAEGHVITIHNAMWDIDKTAPVLFRRTRLTGEMPEPYVDGNYSQLWEFVPVDDADRPLILAWLVQALIQADTPHPVLELLAEHGSVKSTSARCLAQLVDPSPAPLRKAPRDAEGWVTAANASWVVALDNISGEIPTWLSDCLCRAVTGDGDVRRQLYTDSDVSVVAFRRAVIINGIDIQVTQGDLADRLLRIALPRINGGRRAEKVIAAQWAEQWPDILGGLLTLAATVHNRLRSITVADLPRMADFAEVLAAVDQLCGTEGLDRYREQAKQVTADTLDNPFIGTLMDRRYHCRDKTSKEILTALTPNVEDWKKPKDWPANARAVTGQLTRHAPALRAQGWTIDNDDGRNELNRIKWFIQPPEKVCNSDSSNSSNSSEADNTWSDGMWEDELDHELDDRLGEDDNSSDSFDSSDGAPLTSEDELTSQTSQEYTRSLVGEKNLCACGTELVHPESVRRGSCHRCLLRSKHSWAQSSPDCCLECGFDIPAQGHADDCPSNKWKRS